MKKIIRGIEVEVLSEINLRTLFTTERSKLPNLPDENVIYCIHNDLDDKSYIGQAMIFFDRFINRANYLSHLSGFIDYCADQRTNLYLYNALRKHKCRNFTVYILEELDSSDELDVKEIYWISKLNTCIYDNGSWGYNMTHGGKSGDPLNTPEAIMKRFTTLAKKYNGDIMGQCHTPEAHAKSMATNAANWGGDPMGMCHTKEAREKMYRTNALKYDGDIMGQCNTPEALAKRAKTMIKLYGYDGAQLHTPEAEEAKTKTMIERYGSRTGMLQTEEVYLKRRLNKLLDSIEYVLSEVKTEDQVKLGEFVTFEQYWHDIPYGDQTAWNHINKVLEMLSYLRLRVDRWTLEMESIFSYLDNNREAYGIH